MISYILLDPNLGVSLTTGGLVGKERKIKLELASKIPHPEHGEPQYKIGNFVP